MNFNVINSLANTRLAIQNPQKSLSIKGCVNESNTPIPCRVRLFEKLSGRLIADKLTDLNGNYEFDHLAKINFFIVAHHPGSQYNAVIQDNVVPK
ncbi:carboxypeptidase regulatory-like domain-containing protein [Acinetobacter johnsonii]|uniref:carboxypeptidase regulatory-like domain-containing protein n=1 Tax=Acinetobacter johnsonii TaxID=40214 RepID=UPI0024482C98|nr:carboxypeptidase regulatory-like domain-containing protein [Acinetobacter johnsonii]MDH1240759.1 carboxypeptidase regulatory-like domain-containing protein [Acinetobacter johnsonii]